MPTVTISDAAANEALTNLLARLDAGATGALCEVYTGTKPVKPDVAITTQVKLGTLTCSTTAGTVATRALTFGAITQDTAADASGTAAWARFKDSDGLAVVDVDASITGGTGFFQMNTTNIVAGGPILCTSCVITV
jgi:hypothetical protein